MSIYKLITGCNKYAGKEIQYKKDLIKSNIELVKQLKKLKIKELTLTSLGNSIGTGYSANDIIMPLLRRNETLESTMNDNGIDLNMYSFARAQDNNDERILEWILNNITQNEINEKVHKDFSKSDIAMDYSGIDDEKLKEYYPIDNHNNPSINDIINLNEKNKANIIVYNGMTGSFLDNVTRGGKHLNLYGFKRDFISMEAVLKYIYINNSNTQVYVCGIPDLGSLNLVGFLNKKIKKITRKYPNVSYVDSVKQHFIYDKNGNITFDIHYNKNEYLSFNNNIISSMANNYERNMLFIEFDKLLREYSNTTQYQDYSLRMNEDAINKIMEYLYSKYKNTIDKNTLKELKWYYEEKYPYNFFYTSKETIENSINTKQ